MKVWQIALGVVAVYVVYRLATKKTLPFVGTPFAPTGPITPPPANFNSGVGQSMGLP